MTHPPAQVSDAPASVEDGCPRCGALIGESGQQRHDAWHEFIESAITGLTADLASLQPSP